jgi:hypothetical protein
MCRFLKNAYLEQLSFVFIAEGSAANINLRVTLVDRPAWVLFFVVEKSIVKIETDEIVL